ncbi:MAG: proteobacterial dedicated sortase system histidine kinase [Gammaproteobacteria bacterium]
MNRIKLTIRAKLLILSIAVLSIPYVGFQYLRELERHLRDALEISLMDAARAMAGPLHEKANLFPVATASNEKTVYVHTLNHPMQIDGYTDDWVTYLGWSDVYTAGKSGQSQPDPASFRLIVTHYGQYFDVLLQVRDRNVVYQKPDTPDATDNDHVTLVFTDPEGELRHYYFSPSAPGKIRPFRYERHWDEFNFEYRTVEYITNVTGVWQQTEEGYNLEIAIPTGLIGERLGFIVADVDDVHNRRIISRTGTAGESTEYRPGRLLQSSPEIKQIIRGLGKMDGRRVWVLDGRGQVLASGGNLEKSESGQPVNFLYSLILPPVSERFQDDLAGASRLQGQEVLQALQGKTGSRWRTSADGKAIIVSAATPVWVDNAVRGAVVVEETTNSIQMLQRHAMASMFNKTLLVFFIVTSLLLLFATRLSFRLRRLSSEAESAIDEYGRVVGKFTASKAADEIGEVSRNYAAMLERLQHYNNYLEGMAGRLSHELRTPIAVVQSSLENLHSGGTGKELRQYLDRAREGIERLNLLIARLSEATRLEQALQGSEKQQTDIGQLLGNCVEAYRLAYPGIEFRLGKPEQAVVRNVSPDLIVQMLDKLIANAVDFGTEGKPIDVGLLSSGENWTLQVINYGSTLPDAMAGQLFNSMISLREKQGGAEPHLGLGLYIVRIIAEFHQAKITASNLPDRKGVKVVIDFSGGIAI